MVQADSSLMPGVGSAIARDAVGSNLYRWLRSRFYRWNSPRFGLREALLWSTALDTWHRYSALMRALAPQLTADSRILEVGPGWFGLEFFLPAKPDRVGSLVQLDIQARPLLPHPNDGEKVIGSGTTFPIRDDSFDFVVAMDVLEHVPRDARASFSDEVKRVARQAAFLHMPLESDEGSYQAGRCDETFQQWFESRFGRREPNIDEHLAMGHPTLAEVRRYFPNVSVRPTQSVADWLWYMVEERVSPRRALTGLIRYLRGPLEEPPYYSGLATWEAG